MEALERRGKMTAIASIMFIVFWSQCGNVQGQRNNTRMSYICPPNFIRLGHSCYFFSDTEATWYNALFACTDLESNLTVPARWEDRNLRNYLNKPQISNVSRWIGGVYDYYAQTWRWGGDLRKMHYQSFSKMKLMTREELRDKCIAMMPELLYRWSPRNCMETYRYICKRKLQKLPKTKVKEMRRRWQRMGKLNEITAPSISREVNDPMMINDVTVHPYTNPKSYDLRPKPKLGQRKHGARNRSQNAKGHDRKAHELKRRRPGIQRRLKRPFRGYTWNRRDPEGSFQRNVELLRAGRTGLTPQQVNTQLARLVHLRDKQIAQRKRLQDKDDWLVNEPKPLLAQTHARTYTVDNNITALHPKMIVEEFDMLPAPQPVALLKPTRNTG